MVLVSARLTRTSEELCFSFFDGSSGILKNINEYVSPEGRPKSPGVGVNFSLGPIIGHYIGPYFGPALALVGPLRNLAICRLLRDCSVHMSSDLYFQGSEAAEDDPGADVDVVL